MSQTPIFRMIRGDRRTALARTLKQGGEAVDLTGLTVEFKLVADAGTVIQDWTSTGVSVTDAEAGEVQYTFSSTNITDMGSGTVFWYWFRINASSTYTTFPADGRTAKIEVQPAA